jgi:hypothetical protein
LTFRFGNILAVIHAMDATNPYYYRKKIIRKSNIWNNHIGYIHCVACGGRNLIYDCGGDSQISYIDHKSSCILYSNSKIYLEVIDVSIWDDSCYILH